MTNLNPYQSPQEPAEHETRAREIGFLALLPAGIFMGAALGALTNSVNGLVYPSYFSGLMSWASGSLWWRAVIQGAFEGAITGGVFAVVLTAIVGFSSSMCCPLGQAKWYLLQACCAVLTTWLIGGLIGFTWATVDLASFRELFPRAPKFFAGAYAWVGGSIWGGQFGGFGAVLLVSAAASIKESRLKRVDNQY